MKAEVIVRSCGERSLPLCLEAIQKQQFNPLIIQETPSIKASTKIFEIGKNSSADLLIAVDADIILNETALNLMIDEAESAIKKIPNIFLLDFPLIDKFLASCLGCHVYQNKYSKQAYEFLSKIPYDPNEARPEKTNLIKFKEQHGLVNTSHHLTVGLHDYEQYFKHIYVKYFRKAVYQSSFIPEMIDRILQRRMESSEDLDFVVALYGLYSGEGKSDTYTDASHYPTIEEVMDIKEKLPLT